MFWFERSERPKPRARPAGKFRQEFYRKASLVGAVKFGSTAQVGPNFLPKRANCFARAQDLKAGALCEFEYEPREYERRAWRGSTSRLVAKFLVGAVLKTAFRGGFFAPERTNCLVRDRT